MNYIKISFKWIFSFILFALSFSRTLQAYDVHGVITKDCKTYEGLILKVEEDQFSLMDLSGELIVLPTNQIDFLLIYNILENPYRRLTLSTATLEVLRSFKLKEDSESEIIGWHLKTVENQVFIFDITGKSHVVDMNTISKIRKSSLKAQLLNLPSSKVDFSYSGVTSNCLKSYSQMNRPDSQIPIKILADQTQISNYFSELEEGFINLDGFEERTFLYALPVLYDTRTLMGLYSMNKTIQTQKNSFPVYFYWGSARPYGLQNKNLFGTAAVESIPSIDPYFTYQAEIKSHFFRATFNGNLAALSAGTEFFTSSFALEPEKDRPLARSWVGFNYNALMSVDYLRWSIGLGFYYPNYLITVKSQMREILGSKASPILRVMYTTPQYALRFHASDSNISSNQATDKEISIGESDSVEGVLSRFDMKSTWFRLGFDYNFTKETILSIETMYLLGKYTELLSTSSAGFFNFNHLNGMLKVKKYFGDYVQLHFFYNLYNIQNSFSINGESNSLNLSYGEAGGIFEFIF